MSPLAIAETKPAARDHTDFDAIADEYDDSLPHHVVEHYLRKRLAFIQAWTRPCPTLDLGCGTGVLAERVAAAGYDVVALDPSRGMLTQLRRRQPGIPAVAGSGQALPFADDTFGLTYCVAVMHHVAEPDAVRATLTEMARVTRPGGHILVWDHNPRNPYWPLLMRRVPQDTGAERLIPEDEIIRGLRAGGAQPVHAAQLGLMPDFTPPPLVGAMARLERLAERGPGVRRFCAHNVVLAVKAG
ncbi:MAG TPA: methyltransferase domain-containing protein [Thermomicrobiales bacterium]|nr:methyltransferase domain-containing protein [Thermomicrobiales bacterium]